jgi:hypothetical protein
MLETPGASSIRPKLVTLRPLPFRTMCSRAFSAYSQAARKASFAPGHGRGARVVRLADEGEAVPPDAHDALDEPDGQAGRLEVRALLDVQLDVGVEGPRIAARFRHPARVVAGPGHRVHELDAVHRLERRHLGHVELAGEGARAEVAAVAAFLVAPGHHRQRSPRVEPGRLDGLQALEPGQHAQGPVERAALRHRVDVGAGQHRRPLAAEGAERVARRVHARLEAGLGHPAE